MDTPELRDDEIVLRAWSLADAEWYARCSRDPEIQRFTTDPAAPDAGAGPPPGRARGPGGSPRRAVSSSPVIVELVIVQLSDPWPRRRSPAAWRR
ncbi:hypothetical protein GCM10009609_18680 [Pseudonocardia aurantiaca]